MEKTSESEARERITLAAKELFSKKGYDATRLSDMANSASVNKALIYYFKSKQDILDLMVDSLQNNTVSIALDFSQNKIIQMIKNGDLAIQPDRLYFFIKFMSGEEANPFFKTISDASDDKLCSSFLCVYWILPLYWFLEVIFCYEITARTFDF